MTQGFARSLSGTLLSSFFQEVGVQGQSPALPSVLNDRMKRSPRVPYRSDRRDPCYFQLPPIGTMPSHGEARMSTGPWNNGAGAPLCRESRFTSAERNGPYKQDPVPAFLAGVGKSCLFLTTYLGWAKNAV